MEAVRSALESMQARSSDEDQSLRQNLGLSTEEQQWLAMLVPDSQPASVTAALQVVDELAKKAPIFDIEFATPPSDNAIKKVISWLRSEIHPLLFIRIHTVRGLLGGIKVRTGRHQIDGSLQSQLADSSRLLEEEIHGW
ncbi:F0F1 ATP synthase subunit delta [Candidatus Saccharibacteria bacterium]|nr:F0F1 ATP synthase subunit delta [Candidatus Saccharibacteria bacterium]